MTDLQEFKREFFDSDRRLTWIGSGSIGGKAKGLVSISDVLASEFNRGQFPEIEVNIPAFAVIRTDVFDAFIERNDLKGVANSDAGDDVIAHEFQRATIPAEILGDLRGLIEKVHTPLAVRSSSLLEDALYQPFAGIYITKMIPNNQPSPDVRFQKLMEAVKLVYASTFTKSAKDYIRATGRPPSDEKMAVVIQEVVGKRHAERFYPELSGVARSYNFYSMGRAKPEEGVVSLALGLGKTIVDGGRCWSYSPAYPRVGPPYANANELLKQTQTGFWAVNMGRPPAYDPIRETEYMVEGNLAQAEEDMTLGYLASTYDPRSDGVTMGLGREGPRVLNFAGLLTLRDIPFNDAVRSLLAICTKALSAPVEIEFAMTMNPTRIGFLQVRPMVVSDEEISIQESELAGPDVIVASEKVLGNGTEDSIRDIVYVKPEVFEARVTPMIATELERINRKLLSENRPYLLIGFGRWGSSDPWLGIPVNWGQVCGAKVMVEATRPTMNVEISQGSHFFHNITSFKVSYFCVPFTGEHDIAWDWLSKRGSEEETAYVRHIRLPSPLLVRVDGRTGRGVISAR